MGLLEPFMPKNPLMAQAWADCLRWSITEPAILAAFRHQTGCTWSPGSTPLEKMIDQASGAEQDWVVQYVTWFNREIWGKV